MALWRWLGTVPRLVVSVGFREDSTMTPDPETIWSHRNKLTPVGQRVLFYSGDDADAKAEVRKIIEQTGNFPVDLGALDVGGPLASPPFGSLGTINFLRV